MASPPGVPVFYYHVIAEGPLAVPPQVFARQMALLKQSGKTVVALGGLLEMFRCGGDLSNLVCVTFDDGFESTYQHALPVLQALAFRATFFVPVDYVGQRLWGLPETGRWTVDQREGAVAFRMLTWEQVRALHRAGMEIGSHTITHPNLTEVPAEAARQEIAESKKALEDRIGGAVRVFAYPRGRCSPVLARVVEASGYAGACTTWRGYVTPDADPYLLPRIPGSGRVADFVCDVRGIRLRSLRRWMVRLGAHFSTGDQP